MQYGDDEHYYPEPEPGPTRTCAVCGKEVTPDQHYTYHARLGAFVHSGCPKDNVCGEDISGHTMLWHIPNPKDV